jgi:hypothetical protein
MWVAIVLLPLVRPGCPTLTTTAVLADLSVLVVATALICGSTTLLTPFKTTGHADSTQHVSRLGLALSPATARQDAALVAAAGPHVTPGRTPVFATDANSGLAYLLGGVPAGSSWNDDDHTRTAGILALACRRGDVASPPVLLLSRPADSDLVRALAGCGFHYPGGYRRLPVPGGPENLTVMVPDQGR